MKNHRTFRLTDSGIRIPRRKIKRMPPLPEDAPAELARTKYSEMDGPINLFYIDKYIDKLILAPDSKNLPDHKDVIVVDDWKEGGNNGD